MSNITKGNFIKKYKKRMLTIMQQINPEWREQEIEPILDQMILDNLQDPSVKLVNDYTKEERESTLLSILNYELDEHPILAGEFTLYKNQYEALNPNGVMLLEKLAERKAVKGRMWNYLDDKTMYDDLDRLQKVIKVLVNAYYGASGSPTSPFYFTDGGPSITGACQMIISTAEQLFESLVADNYLFLNLTECLEFCETVLKEHTYPDDWLCRVKERDLLSRLLNKIINKEKNDQEVLDAYLSNLSEDDITILYYKHNFFDLIGFNELIRDEFEDILTKVENLEYVDEHDEKWVKKIPKEYRDEYSSKSPKDWNEFVNKMYFMDPNKPPKNIKEELDALNANIMKYVYVDYLSFDRIYRLKNFKRRVVTVIDTDSNFLSLDTIVLFIQDHIIQNKSYGRSFENNVFIVVNTLAYILTSAVTKILYNYCDKANVPEEFRKQLNMKNELFITKLLIGEAKKRYIAKVVLREGNLLKKPKISTTGFDFKKSTTSEYAEEFFTNLIANDIMSDGEIDISEILRHLDAFKSEIIESIKNHETKFLPRGSAKEIEAYRFPEREQSVRGALAWNAIYPDNQIEFPSKVSLLKLKIFREDDILPLKETNPDIYKAIITHIFHDTSGIFNTITVEDDTVRVVNPKLKDWWKNIPKKYRTKYKRLGVEAWNAFAEENATDTSSHEESKIRGMQVLAIPSTEQIPEWVEPYIDLTTIVNDIMSPFMPVAKLFSIKTLEEGQSINGVNRKTEGYSNIIKI